MARPLSEEKRAAILVAAAEAVAAHGAGAATARIAKSAGVAEGTLFTYFATKDDLLNRLYVEIKDGLRASVEAGYPYQASVEIRWRHLWDSYVAWGAANVVEHKALRQLTVSDRVSPQSRALGDAAFAQVMALMRESMAAAVFRDQPLTFVAGVLEALAEMTLEFIAREPSKAEAYSRAGFSAFWNAASRP